MDGKQAQARHRQGGEQGAQRLGQGGVAPKHQQQAPGQAGRGVDLFLQNQRHLVGEDVANHPAGGGGHHPHQNCAEKTEVEGHRLAGADDHEGTQAHGVEIEQGMLQKGELAVPEEDDQRHRDGEVEIGFVLKAEGWMVPQQQVAQGAAAGGGHHPQHQHAEQVHLPTDAGPGARGGKGSGSDQIEGIKQGHWEPPEIARSIAIQQRKCKLLREKSCFEPRRLC